mmetsp:Transcript_101857/g.175831  ORF Transcript_101857/g.175831 Transcript_101857/m.175831 type:complete len:82 (-) Transcript_101857:92-337(-)
MDRPAPSNAPTCMFWSTTFKPPQLFSTIGNCPDGSCTSCCPLQPQYTQCPLFAHEIQLQSAQLLTHLTALVSLVTVEAQTP